MAGAEKVILDAAEHFQKMSYRNRYRIAGANNPNLLTVPLVSGREQRLPMTEVMIHNQTMWQVQHWRTLVSVYKRTPFFEHYEPSLQPLFEAEYNRLVDFNLASIEWVRKHLKLPVEIAITDTLQKDYAADVTDIRNAKAPTTDLPMYHQVFEDRIGFLADLSILDLLFEEGPGARSLLNGTSS